VKILSKAIYSIWMVMLLVIFSFASSVAASTLWSAVPLFVYDGHIAVSAAYDRSSRSAFDYDS